MKIISKFGFYRFAYFVNSAPPHQNLNMLRSKTLVTNVIILSHPQDYKNYKQICLLSFYLLREFCSIHQNLNMLRSKSLLTNVIILPHPQDYENYKQIFPLLFCLFCKSCSIHKILRNIGDLSSYCFAHFMNSVPSTRIWTCREVKAYSRMS